MSANPQPGLFDSPMPDTLTVAELTARVKYLLEDRFADVRVEGEISNFRRHGSGHCYFTLKDADAQIRCVMWRGMTRYLFFKPADGMMVRVYAGLSVYEVRGEYQLVVRQMKPAGEGALSKAFEALKRKLAAEGLFDEVHKKPLPKFPEQVGIITSGTGAALQDMLSVLARRFPQVRVLLCPVQVQGFGAAEEIAAAIDAFGRHAGGPDVLVVARGGGSAEDLWAFNEEVVARAIFECRIPVVSAVGHETDFTIADFVADRRAATPSMAAELIVPDRVELDAYIRGLGGYMRERVSQLIRDRQQRIEYLTGSYLFNRPVDRLRQHQQRLDELAERMTRAVRRCIEKDRRHVDTLDRRLFALNPMRPLQQGYAIVERDGGRISTASELVLNDSVTLRFNDGSRAARITDEGNKTDAEA